MISKGHRPFSLGHLPEKCRHAERQSDAIRQRFQGGQSRARKRGLRGNSTLLLNMRFGTFSGGQGWPVLKGTTYRKPAVENIRWVGGVSKLPKGLYPPTFFTGHFTNITPRVVQWVFVRFFGGGSSFSICRRQAYRSKEVAVDN
jgi:hypothetical protein